MIYVLDTHAVAWFVEDDARLSANAKLILEDLASELVIPTMVLVEVQFLHAKGRIKADLSSVYQQIASANNCIIHPLDENVVAKIPTGLDIHDAIITATAIVYRDLFQNPVTLITKDSKITQSGLIQTLW